MNRIEKLNELKKAREIMIAELLETEKMLGIGSEVIEVYAGGSRYSLAGPGDDKVIGYKEIITYKNPAHLAKRNRLINELEANDNKIRKLESR